MPSNSIAFVWNGTAMMPPPSHPRWVGGRTYYYRESRSPQTHGHQFAWLHDAFLSLPEHYKGRFASEEQLRKWVLIKRGFRNETIHAGFESYEEALRACRMVTQHAEFAIALVNKETWVVTVYTAKSQADLAMDKADFQASKQALLEEIAFMIGTTPEVLGRQGKHSRTRDRRTKHIDSPPLAPDHVKASRKERV